jgi:hypothetical protein
MSDEFRTRRTFERRHEDGVRKTVQQTVQFANEKIREVESDLSAAMEELSVHRKCYEILDALPECHR